MPSKDVTNSGREEFLRRAQAVKAYREKHASRANMNKKNTEENNLAYLAEMERRQQLRASEEESVRAEQMEKFRARAEEWRRSIPDRWQDASLSKIQDVAAREALIDKIDRHKSNSGRNRSSMVIAGLLGRGKTYLGYAYAYEMITRGFLQPHQVVTTTETTLSSITRAGFKADEKWNDLVVGKRFWLINDVGRSDFPVGTKRMEIWHDLVDHIYETRGTLVITTNLPPTKQTSRGGASLEDWIGNSTMDRIRHMVDEKSGFVIMTGTNQREEVGQNLEEEYNRTKRA